MLLKYYLNQKGERVYTLKDKIVIDGREQVTLSAHPARFTPEDKYSEQRILIKKRFCLLPIQQEPISY